MRALAVLLVALVACTGGEVSTATGDSPPDATATTERATTTTERTTTTTVPTPDPEDFTLAVVVVSKQCFGTAGCVVEYEVEITEGPWLAIGDDWSGDLTYEVTGDESGPIIDTLTLTGDQYTQPGFQSASTPSNDTALTAVVTRVVAR